MLVLEESILHMPRHIYAKIRSNTSFAYIKNIERSIAFFLFFSICLDVPHLTNEHITQDCIAS